MNRFFPIWLLGVLGITSTYSADTYTRWTENVTITEVAPETECHSIHAYFNTCPESPNGQLVLYYTSKTPEGELGEIRILERETGKIAVIATDIATEDAHRAACQQWANAGQTVVYHEVKEERWRVLAYDVASGETKVLVEDRQLGFGAANHPWVPVYGCHWNPGEHRDLELVHVETGEIRKPVTIEEVVAKYEDWVMGEFLTPKISVFFPVMSPDGKKVFFKLTRPSGGTDYRSMKASYRQGKVVYDIAEDRLVRLFEKWGHPSWDPTSMAILEKGGVLSDIETGKSKRFSPSSPTNHPSLSPDGTLVVTDANVSKRDFGNPDDWAIVVADTREDRFTVVDQFNNTHGAKSWRPSHPHPVFSADGRRIYYNVSAGKWTRLFVAECNEETISSANN